MITVAELIEMLEEMPKTATVIIDLFNIDRDELDEEYEPVSVEYDAGDTVIKLTKATKKFK